MVSPLSNITIRLRTDVASITVCFNTLSNLVLQCKKFQYCTFFIYCVKQFCFLLEKKYLCRVVLLFTGVDFFAYSFTSILVNVR